MSDHVDITDDIDDDLTEEMEMFVEAQDTVWNDVRAELSAGKKTSHWMWFVFPQLADLGQSHMAQLYGIEDLAEATAYLAHPVLRTRLTEASELLLSHKDRSAQDILGETDAKKLRSSMTLFTSVSDAPQVFNAVLETFFDGIPCPVTHDALG
ncbi:DUF1810 domain-containing protein [Phaeobacter inhibens]|uniref:Uncharacterized protein n=1 Tax=Phaeobacter inhibens TaxID=221822 RepID=A0A135IEF5_9RHOB|nr:MULTISPECIES: DUF1810 domain-containing protein [Phaeobacter]AFO93129.1 hypothetical protein PGA1_c34930 [Phaeobacter inhibens DSM 17395]AUQ47831.1 hypothetical protein PhaeoP10_03542 [Phaeobacter inhibens]AUQ64331.1 hypothetical protein PhaeoP51_03399 [Phaeobacter inhibens]AUQ84235.1 hypothetical protein PhaeoP57_03362 [Phaeobacter inhibens]AUQ92044.1 hypothetical protein PhaeoP24_03480 [Phaeobacter inhibens]